MGGFFFSIFSSLFGTWETRILIWALNGPGKTMISYRLQVGEVVATIPTIGFISVVDGCDRDPVGVES
uniref:Uncharacterized protein n=1 Tax=Felis catus TaxID=9685 RepID=A0ABI7WU08_FELCA